ncbi:MAG: hypothetical protein DRR19_28460 [Candidatus Parabeggiatoa sp. nov. 1]|nr:MAG: hypothetical protein DRR19_28460 [Gammaproteobacteria bacterium]
MILQIQSTKLTDVTQKASKSKHSDGGQVGNQIGVPSKIIVPTYPPYGLMLRGKLQRANTRMVGKWAIRSGYPLRLLCPLTHPTD